jgi:hypothetical protein
MRPNVEHQEDPTLDQSGERTSREHTSDQTGEGATEHPTQRVTVAEAARLLGTSAEAVRMRVKRGSLRSTKIKNTVYVLLRPEQTRPNQDQTSGSVGSAANQTSDQTTKQPDDRTLLLNSLRSQVEFLQEELKRREEVHVEENRRKDTIIAQLTQRIPELEPPTETPQEPREGQGTASEEFHGTHAPPAPEQPVERPSWWRRFFGFE